MNAMMAAFNKAATKDQELRKLVNDSRTYHKEKIQLEIQANEEKKRIADMEYEKIQESIATQDRLIHEASCAENRKKNIYSWRVVPEKYAMVCGIMFADTLEEVIPALEKLYPAARSIKAEECDCSKPVVYIGEYSE